MNKKRAQPQPKLWIASISARERATGNVYDGLAISTSAFVTRKAGQKAVEIQMYQIFPPQQYSRHKINFLHGMSRKYIDAIFDDLTDDDDDHGPDEPEPVNPDPEDHGVEAPEPVVVPALFATLIDSLEVEDL